MPEENKLTQHQKDRRRAKDLLKEVRKVKADYDGLAKQVSDVLDELQTLLDELETLKEKHAQSVKTIPDKEKFTDEYGRVVFRKYKRDLDGLLLFQDSWTGPIGLEESTHWKEYDPDEDG